MPDQPLRKFKLPNGQWTDQRGDGAIWLDWGMKDPATGMTGSWVMAGNGQVQAAPYDWQPPSAQPTAAEDQPAAPGAPAAPPANPDEPWYKHTATENMSPADIADMSVGQGTQGGALGGLLAGRLTRYLAETFRPEQNIAGDAKTIAAYNQYTNPSIKMGLMGKVANTAANIPGAALGGIADAPSFIGRTTGNAIQATGDLVGSQGVKDFGKGTRDYFGRIDTDPEKSFQGRDIVSGAVNVGARVASYSTPVGRAVGLPAMIGGSSLEGFNEARDKGADYSTALLHGGEKGALTALVLKVMGPSIEKVVPGMKLDPSEVQTLGNVVKHVLVRDGSMALTDTVIGNQIDNQLTRKLGEMKGLSQDQIDSQLKGVFDGFGERLIQFSGFGLGGALERNHNVKQILDEATTHSGGINGYIADQNKRLMDLAGRPGVDSEAAAKGDFDKMFQPNRMKKADRAVYEDAMGKMAIAVDYGKKAITDTMREQSQPTDTTAPTPDAAPVQPSSPTDVLGKFHDYLKDETGPTQFSDTHLKAAAKELGVGQESDAFDRAATFKGRGLNRYDNDIDAAAKALRENPNVPEDVRTQAEQLIRKAHDLAFQDKAKDQKHWDDFASTLSDEDKAALKQGTSGSAEPQAESVAPTPEVTKPAFDEALLAEKKEEIGKRIEKLPAAAKPDVSPDKVLGHLRLSGDIAPDAKVNPKHVESVLKTLAENNNDPTKAITDLRMLHPDVLAGLGPETTAKVLAGAAEYRTLAADHLEGKRIGPLREEYDTKHGQGFFEAARKYEAPAVEAKPKAEPKKPAPAEAEPKQAKPKKPAPKVVKEAEPEPVTKKDEGGVSLTKSGKKRGLMSPQRDTEEINMAAEKRGEEPPVALPKPKAAKRSISEPVVQEAAPEPKPGQEAEHPLPTEGEVKAAKAATTAEAVAKVLPKMASKNPSEKQWASATGKERSKDHIKAVMDASRAYALGLSTQAELARVGQADMPSGSWSRMKLRDFLATTLPGGINNVHADEYGLIQKTLFKEGLLEEKPGKGGAAGQQYRPKGIMDMSAIRSEHSQAMKERGEGTSGRVLEPGTPSKVRGQLMKPSYTALTEGLTPKERTAVELFYGIGAGAGVNPTYANVGRAMGESRQTVQAMMNRVFGLMTHMYPSTAPAAESYVDRVLHTLDRLETGPAALGGRPDGIDAIMDRMRSTGFKDLKTLNSLAAGHDFAPWVSELAYIASSPGWNDSITKSVRQNEQGALEQVDKLNMPGFKTAFEKAINARIAAVGDTNDNLVSKLKAASEIMSHLSKKADSYINLEDLSWSKAAQEKLGKELSPDDLNRTWLGSGLDWSHPEQEQAYSKMVEDRQKISEDTYKKLAGYTGTSLEDIKQHSLKDLQEAWAKDVAGGGKHAKDTRAALRIVNDAIKRIELPFDTGMTAPDQSGLMVAKMLMEPQVSYEKGGVAIPEGAYRTIRDLRFSDAAQNALVLGNITKSKSFRSLQDIMDTVSQKALDENHLPLPEDHPQVKGIVLTSLAEEAAKMLQNSGKKAYIDDLAKQGLDTNQLVRDIASKINQALPRHARNMSDAMVRALSYAASSLGRATTNGKTFETNAAHQWDWVQRQMAGTGLDDGRTVKSQETRDAERASRNRSNADALAMDAVGSLNENGLNRGQKKFVEKMGDALDQAWQTLKQVKEERGQDPSSSNDMNAQWHMARQLAEDHGIDQQYINDHFLPRTLRSDKSAQETVRNIFDILQAHGGGREANTDKALKIFEGALNAHADYRDSMPVDEFDAMRNQWFNPGEEVRVKEAPGRKSPTATPDQIATARKMMAEGATEEAFNSHLADQIFGWVAKDKSLDKVANELEIDPTHLQGMAALTSGFRDFIEQMKPDMSKTKQRVAKLGGDHKALLEAMHENFRGELHAAAETLFLKIAEKEGTTAANQRLRRASEALKELSNYKEEAPNNGIVALGLAPMAFMAGADPVHGVANGIGLVSAMVGMELGARYIGRRMGLERPSLETVGRELARRAGGQIQRAAGIIRDHFAAIGHRITEPIARMYAKYINPTMQTTQPTKDTSAAVEAEAISPSVKENPIEGHAAMAEHGAASRLANDLYEQRMSTPGGQDEPVLIMVGNAATGKSTIAQANAEHYHTVLDTNAADPQGLQQHINMALRSGRPVDVLMTHADLPEAVRRNIMRQGQEGRPVSIVDQADLAVKAPSSFTKAHEIFGQDPNVSFSAYDTQAKKSYQGQDAADFANGLREQNAGRSTLHTAMKAYNDVIGRNDARPTEAARAALERGLPQDTRVPEAADTGRVPVRDREAGREGREAPAAPEQPAEALSYLHGGMGITGGVLKDLADKLEELNGKRRLQGSKFGDIELNESKSPVSQAEGKQRFGFLQKAFKQTVANALLMGEPAMDVFHSVVDAQRDKTRVLGEGEPILKAIQDYTAQPGVGEKEVDSLYSAAFLSSVAKQPLSDKMLKEIGLDEGGMAVYKKLQQGLDNIRQDRLRDLDNYEGKMESDLLSRAQDADTGKSKKLLAELEERKKDIQEYRDVLNNNKFYLPLYRNQGGDMKLELRDARIKEGEPGVGVTLMSRDQAKDPQQLAEAKRLMLSQLAQKQWAEAGGKKPLADYLKQVQADEKAGHFETLLNENVGKDVEFQRHARLAKGVFDQELLHSLTQNLRGGNNPDISSEAYQHMSSALSHTLTMNGLGGVRSERGNVPGWDANLPSVLRRYFSAEGTVQAQMNSIPKIREALDNLHEAAQSGTSSIGKDVYDYFNNYVHGTLGGSSRVFGDAYNKVSGTLRSAMFYSTMAGRVSSGLVNMFTQGWLTSRPFLDTVYRDMDDRGKVYDRAQSTARAMVFKEMGGLGASLSEKSDAEVRQTLDKYITPEKFGFLYKDGKEAAERMGVVKDVMGEYIRSAMRETNTSDLSTFEGGAKSAMVAKNKIVGKTKEALGYAMEKSETANRLRDVMWSTLLATSSKKGAGILEVDDAKGGNRAGLKSFDEVQSEMAAQVKKERPDLSPKDRAMETERRVAKKVAEFAEMTNAVNNFAASKGFGSQMTWGKASAITQPLWAMRAFGTNLMFHMGTMKELGAMLDRGQGIERNFVGRNKSYIRGVALSMAMSGLFGMVSDASELTDLITNVIRKFMPGKLPNWDTEREVHEAVHQFGDSLEQKYKGKDFQGNWGRYMEDLSRGGVSRPFGVDLSGPLGPGNSLDIKRGKGTTETIGRLALGPYASLVDKGDQLINNPDSGRKLQALLPGGMAGIMDAYRGNLSPSTPDAGQMEPWERGVRAVGFMPTSKAKANEYGQLQADLGADRDYIKQHANQDFKDEGGLSNSTSDMVDALRERESKYNQRMSRRPKYSGYVKSENRRARGIADWENQ